MADWGEGCVDGMTVYLRTLVTDAHCVSRASNIICYLACFCGLLIARYVEKWAFGNVLPTCPRIYTRPSDARKSWNSA